MKALIFAAGIGSRLKPFTNFHPKALAPVGGVPMLERVILKLKAIGIGEMVVNVHHFSDQIIKFLQDKNYFGITIHISDESDLLLDTGGGMLKARQWLCDDDFIVHNADILTDVDIEAMVRSHHEHNPLATLLVAERSTSRYLLFDEGMIMRGWTNVISGQILPPTLDPDLAASLHQMAFGGVHVVSPRIFPLLEGYSAGINESEGSNTHGPVFSIMPFYIDACSHENIMGYASQGDYTWYDIGKPSTLDLANKEFIG